jgi:tetratricopeptide (TPR) repeat protein
VSLLKRLFSADYRAAVAAEAAGDLELAAERYALAGEHDAAVRVHMARAQRADKRTDQIKALRDALHWASMGISGHREVKAALARSLLSRAREEGVATERDRDRVREAANLFAEAEYYHEAGEAFESIGDDRAAARVYEAGGLVFRMEAVMLREATQTDRQRRLDRAFSEYELYLAGGQRRRARDALRTCVETAERKSEYRKLLDALETRLIGSGRVALRRRGGAATVLVAGATVVVGRDSLCQLPLRSGGISRQHAEVQLVVDAGQRQYRLRDLHSRNGTLVGGVPIAGSLPLRDQGMFSLGDDCQIEFAICGQPEILQLTATSGLDRGLTLWAGAEGDWLPVGELPLAVRFDAGCPVLKATDGSCLALNCERVAVGEVELIHGDQLAIAGVEVEVS